MIDRECIVGVYNPNPAVTRAFRGWRTIPVYRNVLPVAGRILAGNNIPGPYEVAALDRYDNSLNGLAQAAMRRARFTVARDDTYYSWRFDSYPLARAEYFALLRAGEPTGFCVVLWGTETLSIADFSAQSPETLIHLVRHVLARAHSRNVLSATIATSQETLSRRLVAEFGGNADKYQNYYHFSQPLLAQRGFEADVDRIWNEGAFHETEATGDVLLR